MKKLFLVLSLVGLAGLCIAASTEWTDNIPSLAGQISTEYPQIEKNFEELKEILDDITDGTVGTTDTASFRVKEVAAANNSYIKSRNAADGGDVNIIKANAADDIEVASGLVLNEDSGGVTTGANDGGLLAEELDSVTGLSWVAESAGNKTPIIINSYLMFDRPGTFEWKDADEIYLNGAVYNVGGKIAFWDSQLTEQITTAAGAWDWWYVYLDYSAITSGTEITATEIITATTEPSYDHAKKGWYNSDDRCIFAVVIDSSNNIQEFFHDGNQVWFADQLAGGQATMFDFDYTNIDVDTTWDDVYLTIPKFAQKANITILTSSVGDAGKEQLFWRTNGQSGSTGHVAAEVGADVERSVAIFAAYTDTSGIIELKYQESAGDTFDAYTNGFYLPRDM